MENRVPLLGLRGPSTPDVGKGGPVGYLRPLVRSPCPPICSKIKLVLLEHFILFYGRKLQHSVE